MKKNWMGWILGLGITLVAPFVLAMGTFEGIVDYHFTMRDGKTMDTEYQIKGEKLRMDSEMHGMQMSTIMDLQAKKVTSLMHKQKMYTETILDKSLTGEAAHKYEGKFYKASGSKTILGYTCEHWVYEGKMGKTDIWATTGLGSIMALGGQKSGSAEDWIKAAKAKGIFALEVEVNGKEGKSMTMTATKIEKKSLSASLFEVPAGYKKMPGMEGMGSMGKQPSKDDILKSMKPKLPF